MFSVQYYVPSPYREGNYSTLIPQPRVIADWIVPCSARTRCATLLALYSRSNGVRRNKSFFSFPGEKTGRGKRPACRVQSTDRLLMTLMARVILYRKCHGKLVREPMATQSRTIQRRNHSISRKITYNELRITLFMFP